MFFEVFQRVFQWNGFLNSLLKELLIVAKVVLIYFELTVRHICKTVLIEFIITIWQINSVLHKNLICLIEGLLWLKFGFLKNNVFLFLKFIVKLIFFCIFQHRFNLTHEAISFFEAVLHFQLCLLYSKFLIAKWRWLV